MPIMTFSSDRQIREQADVLKGAGDAALQHAMRRQAADLLAGKADGAALGRDEPGDGVEQGRFARAVRPDHRDDPMRRDAQRYRAQRDEPAKTHGQIGDFEERPVSPDCRTRRARRAAKAAAARVCADCSSRLSAGDPPRRRDQPLAAIEHHQHQDQPENQLDRRGELDVLQPLDIDEAARAHAAIATDLRETRIAGSAARGRRATTPQTLPIPPKTTMTSTMTETGNMNISGVAVCNFAT